MSEVLRMTGSRNTTRKSAQRLMKYRYLTYFPRGYDPRRKKGYPLLLFLHGAGERGSKLGLVKKLGPIREIERGRDLPFIVLAPQCPSNGGWNAEALAALLDDFQAGHNVNPARVYLTGLSMGSHGVWMLANAHPERFAAIAPVCPPVLRNRVPGRFKDMPAWVFHGAMDSVVPITNSLTMVRAIRKAGGSVRLTIYPDAGHDSWTQAYGNPALYRWFLKHRRKA